jgi:hypothetical protein
MKSISVSVFVCAALLAGMVFACGGERTVRRTTMVQETLPAPTPAQRVIRTEERTLIQE